jgi:hypothetical protein
LDAKGVFLVGATADTIWRVPAYLPYLQPPLTDETVALVENEIGYTLPGEYLNLLRKQNGGYIRYSLPENVHNTIAGIGPFFPSLSRLDWEKSQEHVSYQLQGLVPFDGDGHWHLCLDYRKNQPVPAITLADIELNEETQIASSFADYLGMLRIRVDDEYVLEAVSDIEEVKACLSVQLGAEFEPPGPGRHSLEEIACINLAAMLQTSRFEIGVGPFRYARQIEDDALHRRVCLQDGGDY